MFRRARIALTPLRTGARRKKNRATRRLPGTSDNSSPASMVNKPWPGRTNMASPATIRTTPPAFFSTRRPVQGCVGGRDVNRSCGRPASMRGNVSAEAIKATTETVAKVGHTQVGSASQAGRAGNHSGIVTSDTASLQRGAPDTRQPTRVQRARSRRSRTQGPPCIQTTRHLAWRVWPAKRLRAQ